MKKKKIVVSSVIAILVISVIILSYLLIVVTREKELIVQEISKVEVEPQRTKPEMISTSTWDIEKVNIVNDTEGTPVPVPKGYVASSIDGEHTIDNGFVIYEGEEAVTEENKVAAQEERNQWVWIPIYYPDEMYGRDANGAAHGKLYEYGYTGRTRLNWTMSNGVMKTSIDYEPIRDSLSSTYIPDYLSEEGKEYSKEFEEMIASVEKYGGFYIGRYETGSLFTIAKVVRGNTDIKSKTWNVMKTKCKELKGTNENVITNMIWGSMWDATLEWLVDTGCKTYEEVGVNSSCWGNYEDNTVSGHGTRQATGYSEEWKANNIYDMAGNVCDFIQEGNRSQNARGGSYSSKGSYYPADSRNGSSINTSYDSHGCRATLYLGL